MDLDDLAELIRRPAVRRFDLDRGVPAAAVSRLISVARWTGSARNRQPWRFVEVRDRVIIAQLATLGAYAQFVADAPVVVALAAAEDGFTDTAFDVGRVLQSIVLAANAMGLGSCPATVFPAANVETARTLLGLSADWAPRHLLALGYAGPVDAPTGRSAIPGGRLTNDELLTTIE